MTDRSRAPWLVYALASLCIAAIAAAYLVVGPASESASALSRTVTVAEGVVQSTVSGSGNLQAASQLDLGFKTSGVVNHIYVTQGEHVSAGQLLATLNPQSAEVTLEEAKAALQAAEATLAQEEESGGESPGTTSTAKAGAAAFSPGTTGATGATGPTGTGAPASPTAGTPTATTSTTTTSSTRGAPAAATTAPASSTQRTTTVTTATEKAKQSAATRDANLASAKATVKSDRLAVQSAEETVADTRLYAPHSGTIVSLSGEVGETVSGAGTSKASTSSSSSGGTASSGAATGTSSGRTATGGSSSSATGSSSSSSSSSSGFAVLSDLSSIQLVVPLSESEVGRVSVGQPATVTVEALEGRKVAAQVIGVATLATSNSGVVSYDVTFQLNQLTSGLKPGMSASAEVVVQQAEGVNVPTTAISGGSVTVIDGDKRVRRAVVTGLAGNSSTIILSGLTAGEKIALPIAATSSGSSSLTSRLGKGLGGGGLGGGFGGGGLGGGGFRGGG